MSQEITGKDSELLLALASYQAACCLGLQHSEVKEILHTHGLDNSSNSTSTTDNFLQQNCLMFIRMCRALDGVFCGNLKEEQEWLGAENTILNKTPKTLMQSPNGLAAVVEYLEGLLQHGKSLSH